MSFFGNPTTQATETETAKGDTFAASFLPLTRHNQTARRDSASTFGYMPTSGLCYPTRQGTVIASEPIEPGYDCGKPHTFLSLAPVVRGPTVPTGSKTRAIEATAEQTGGQTAAEQTGTTAGTWGSSVCGPLRLL